MIGRVFEQACKEARGRYASLELCPGEVESRFDEEPLE
jgi:hypothetical protein